MRRTFGQRYFAISRIIAQSAFLCSLFALADSLNSSFFGVSLGLLPSAFNAPLALAIGVRAGIEAGDPSFFSLVEVLLSLGLFRRAGAAVNLRCWLPPGRVPIKLGQIGEAYRAGRKHDDRAA